MSSILPPGEERGELLWRADYSKQDAASAGYRIKSNNLDALPRNVPVWPPPVITPGAPVPHPPGSLNRCLQFALPRDCVIKRYEVEPAHRHFADGEEVFFGFAFCVDDGFPLADDGWQVIWQLHGEPRTGSPPVSFLAQKNRLWINGGWGRPGAEPADRYQYEKALVDIGKSTWHSCVCRVRFESAPGAGAVSLWVNGAEILRDFAPPCGTNYTYANGTPGRAYLKNGVYRKPTVPSGGAIYFAAQALGTGYGSVDPLSV